MPQLEYAHLGPKPGSLYRQFFAQGQYVRAQTLYLASHPELAGQALVDGPSTFLKVEQEGRAPQGLGLLGGMGLLTNPNFELWRTQRRMMQPMFHRAKLASMGDKMTQAAGQILGRWEALETVDIDAEMLHVTMDIICRTMFSTDISGNAGRAAQASEVALQSLRVCWENRAGQYNCGRCEKCLRTMSNLRIAGALERCTTFSSRLDMSAISRVQIPDECARVFIEENLEAAQQKGDVELSWALARSLTRKQGRFTDRVMRGDLPGRIQRRVKRALVGSTPQSFELPEMRPSP